ncbi:hypothetical protein [Clostridium gasigenes]|uniref:Uncharacterized protein n=1 Tax=Clostridium gasigenes TaxID=94869 RepID=A0A1H0N6N5_9CLOT|nr:hypothetical protein [Clostridium gasigenes]SDO88342.1 hypothetical protein SAMN04488529_101712 [Clostridium gasigenes]
MIKELDFNKTKSITEECIVMADKIDEIIKVVNSITDPKATKILKDGIEIIGGELNITGTICNVECCKATVGYLQCDSFKNDSLAISDCKMKVDETLLRKANIETLKNNKLI